MNRRNLIDLLFSALLCVSLATHFYFYLEFQTQTERFMSAGKRFTAKSGQEICERLRVVEAKLFEHVDSCLYDR